MISKTIQKTIHKHDELIKKIQICRQDLDSKKIKAECGKMAESSHNTTITSLLEFCAYNAMAGKPMPWESQV